MRLGIRAKQTAGVTIIVGIFVVGLSALYVSQLATSVLGEHGRQAALLIEQIRYRAFDVVPDAPDPYVALREAVAVYQLSGILGTDGARLGSDRTYPGVNPIGVRAKS